MLNNIKRLNFVNTFQSKDIQFQFGWMNYETITIATNPITNYIPTEFRDDAIATVLVEEYVSDYGGTRNNI